MRPLTTIDESTDSLSTGVVAAWFGVYVLLAILSFAVLRDAVSQVMPVWLPAGIGFGLQLRVAPRERLPLAAALFAIEFAVEESLGVYRSVPLHLVYSACVALESLIGAVVAIRLNGGRRVRLDSIGELRAFLGGAIVGSIVVASLAALYEVSQFEESFIFALLTWVQADLVAILVLSPLVLLPSITADVPLRGRLSHALAVFGTIVVAVVLLFGRREAADSVLVALTFLVFPPLIWAALAFGVVGAACGSLVTSILVGVLSEIGFGPIAALGFSDFKRQLVSQGFVGLLSMSALTIGVLTRQQSLTLRRLRAALDDSEESAARFRAFFESAPEMLAAVDREGRLVLANQQWMREIAASRDRASVLGQPVEHFAASLGAAATVTVDWWRRALAGETIVTPWEAPRADGAVGVYEMTLAPLRDDGGRVVGAYMSVRDVAAWRQRQVAEARARRLETVGRLAGGVAHDFNNIVTGIQGYVTLLEDALPPDEQVHADLGEIRRAGDRAAELTRQLLAYARRQVIEPRQVHVPELLQGISGLLQRVIGEDVVLQVDAPEDAWPVRVDPGQLEQVIMNLAVNARDAMPTGGRLIIECLNVTIDADEARRRELEVGDFHVIAVSDTGIGMTPEVLERVFEPFFTTKEAGRGTGLGLATVDGIVRQAGGAITAYSEVGIGTTLRVYLPRDRAPRVVAAPVVQPTQRPHGSELIVLVEDDHALRPLARRVLEGHGFSVVAFPDSAAALTASDEMLAAASMLLTDVVLPGLNGRELAVRLTARAPHLRVLYMSGYTEDAIVHHGIVDLGVSFLAKPFTPAQLLERVRRVLDG